MKKRYLLIAAFLILLLTLTDIYVYKGVKLLAAGLPDGVRSFILYGFWCIFILFLAIVLIVLFSNLKGGRAGSQNLLFQVNGFLMLIFIPSLLFAGFHFLEDLLRLTLISVGIDREVNEISIVGAALASVPFFAIAYGILIGRFRFHVKEKEIISSHLPDEFDGTRIVHISDLHIGSYWGNTKQLSKVFSMINREKPDMILYTGDMINTFAEEAERFVPQLSSLRARYGKFSVLGNHDYGEYYIWPSENEKINNLERLKAIQAESGFRLLLNESYTIEKGGKKLAILGVENWGLPPFKARGDLQKAIDKTETDSYKILLSHDPSHFPEEVAGRTNIDLTLSGHTHGMQFGFEIAGKKWSPVSLKYKYWDGLYKVGDQFIHVNRGIGFIGFPGRIGMLPEVSVLVLHKR